MKAIGIKMVELQPMFSGEARIKGYKVLESLGDNELILSLKLFKMKNEKI